MPLFQQSVLKKYLNDLDKLQLQAAWRLFEEHFLNPVIQQNIRDSKEEEYQEGFVRDLFVKVLGYTLNPQPDYNFVLEKKTITDATKSDGAVLLNKEVIGVVELKDTGTPDLDKVSNQAFGYKHKHKNCTYVITSNFEKLRFYINDSTDHEEFELFTLTYQRFALLYLCLHKQSLLAGIPLKIKQASLVQEENVTKKLYADYSVFKRELFQNIAEQNTQYDKLLLFKKTQKLLDRFLFILFAEDRLLLPPNSVREILKQWEDLKTQYDEYFPLYGRFKKYFGYLNTGHVGKQHEIFAYNGGLFMADEVLDNIIIDDTILFEGTKTLSTFDFATEVDVNILGHIFEHSLTEIEELQAEMEGKPVEKNKTKRKKDGVFYTPRYITKYIVENTVGALCTQKKEELQINDEMFSPKKRKDRRKILLDKIEAYRNWLLQLTICDPACGSGAFLNAALEYLIAEHRTADELKARIFGDAIVYTDIENSILENNLYGVDINEDAIEIAKLSLWLHTAEKGRKLSNLSNNIKCGNSLIDDAGVAGDKAFNWQSEFPAVFGKRPQLFLEFIKNLQEGIKLYDITPAEEEEAFKKLKPSAIQLLEKSIAKQINNLHDYITAFFLMVNGETENTGFLWLSMLMKHPDNEQLIKEFSEGNNVPTPAIYYVLIKNFLKDLEENFDVYEEFYLAQHADDENVGFDVVIGNPPYVRADSSGNSLEFREYLMSNGRFRTLSGKWDLYIPFVELSILLLKKEGISSLIIPDAFCHANYSYKSLRWLQEKSFLFGIDYFPEMEIFKSVGVQNIILTLKKSNSNLFRQRVFKNESNYEETITMEYPQGFRLDYRAEIIINKANLIKLEEIFYISVGIVGNSDEKFYRGEFEVGDLLSNMQDDLHPKLYFEGKDIDKWILKRRHWIEYGTDRSPKKWRRKSFTEFFESGSKLVAMRSPGYKPKILLDELQGYFNESAIGFKRWIELEGVNNKSLKNAYLTKEDRIKFEKLSGRFDYKYLICILNSKFVAYILNSDRRSNIHIYPEDYKTLKIPTIPEQDQQLFIDKADIMLSKNKELNQLSQQLTQLFQAKFPSININNKLQAWPSLKPNEFLKELQKQKIKLTLSEQQEWLQYFEEQKLRANNIQQIIQQTDKEIDAMVYELYGLSEEEIAIVEGK